MSGMWRVTVDSWITDEATWYGITTYVVSGEHVHSLPAALQAIAESPPEVYLAPVAEGESGIGAAPTEVNVPTCVHGRGRAHEYCTGPQKPVLCYQCGRPEAGVHSRTRNGGYLTGHCFVDPKDVCGHTAAEGCTGHGDF